MKHGLRSLFTTLLLLLAASCVSTSVTPLTASTYPATSPEDVVVYLDEADVPQPFTKLAIIYAEGSTSTTNQDDMLKKARKEAAALGSNGLILTKLDEPSAGVKMAAKFFGGETHREGEMVAIRIHSGE